jgi:uncharacterized membrane protein
MMKTIQKSIEVDAPVRAVYNQWTQFESFPQFMSGVKEVRQIDDTHLHWCANVGGKDVEWDAEIVEQVPDTCISWRATQGKANAGTVRFDKLDECRTRVSLAMEIEPETVVEKIGTAVGVPTHRVEGDLERFKEFIEDMGSETGGWRGEVHGGRETKPH